MVMWSFVIAEPERASSVKRIAGVAAGVLVRISDSERMLGGIAGLAAVGHVAVAVVFVDAVFVAVVFVAVVFVAVAA